MKNRHALLSRPFHLIRTFAGLGCVGLCLLANSGQAATLYFDSNGTTSGYGSGGSWDAANWATVTGGTSATADWGAGDFAKFSTAASSTVTVNASESMAGLYNTISTATLTINASGSGNLSITTNGGTLFGNGFAQGFFTTGPVIINAPIVGAGGIEQETTAALSLFGNNTYSGPTDLTGGQFTYYNNDNSFGSGTIYINGSGEAMLNNNVSTAVTIPNNIVFPTANYNINLVGGNAIAGAPGTTYSGSVTLPSSGTTTLNTSSTATTVDGIKGVISGNSALAVADIGTLVLSATNKYTGATIISGGSTLQLAATNSIVSSGSLVLSNGFFSVSGFDQTMTNTTLSLKLSSTINFGVGGSALVFSNSAALTWSGTLFLTNFSFTADSLRVCTTSSGLTPTQLGDIDINGTKPAELLLSPTGFLEVPEPSPAILGVAGVVGFVWMLRRRNA